MVSDKDLNALLGTYSGELRRFAGLLREGTVLPGVIGGRLLGITSVTDYGAAPGRDPITNRMAIQQCIDENRSVLLSAGPNGGVFDLAGDIEITSPRHIIIDEGTTLRLAPEAVFDHLTWSPREGILSGRAMLVIRSGGTGTTIEARGEIDMNGLVVAGGSNSSGIFVDKASKIKIIGPLRLRRAKQGIWLVDSDFSLIDGPWCDDSMPEWPKHPALIVLEGCYDTVVRNVYGEGIAEVVDLNSGTRRCFIEARGKNLKEQVVDCNNDSGSTVHAKGYNARLFSNMDVPQGSYYSLRPVLPTRGQTVSVTGHYDEELAGLNNLVVQLANSDHLNMDVTCYIENVPPESIQRIISGDWDAELEIRDSHFRINVEATALAGLPSFNQQWVGFASLRNSTIELNMRVPVGDGKAVRIYGGENIIIPNPHVEILDTGSYGIVLQPVSQTPPTNVTIINPGLTPITFAGGARGSIISGNVSGLTTERPSNVAPGTFFFDETLGKPIWWNGATWVDSTGQSQ